jgi:hypothetical protein
MDKTHFIHIDYNSQGAPPSRPALLGEKPLRPFAAAMAFLVGLGAIMCVVTFFLTRAG